MRKQHHPTMQQLILKLCNKILTLFLQQYFKILFIKKIAA